MNKQEFSGRSLSEVQRATLREAIGSVFEVQEFSTFLAAQFPKQHLCFTDRSGGRDTDGAQLVRTVVDAAAADGWWEELLAKAQAEKPNDTGLAHCTEALRVVGAVEGSAFLVEGSLEKTIRRHLPGTNVLEWSERLRRTMGAICRIQVPTNAGVALGTGYLITPDTVLTNWHVVEHTLPGKVPICSFDAIAPGGSGADVPAMKENWLIAHSSYGGTGQGLDFAVIRLRNPPPITAGHRREPLQLPDAPVLLKSGDPLVILGHPNGRAMEISLGAFLARDRNRLTYDPNTEPGSSGSPCLNAELQVVGLHHAAGNEDQNTNYGIEASLIRADIERQAGVGELVEALLPQPFQWPPNDIPVFLRQFDLSFVDTPLPMAFIRALDAATPSPAQRDMVVRQANEWLSEAGPVLQDIQPQVELGLLQPVNGPTLEFWLSLDVHARSQGARVFMGVLAASPTGPTQKFQAWIERTTLRYRLTA